VDGTDPNYGSKSMKTGMKHGKDSYFILINRAITSKFYIGEIVYVNRAGPATVKAFASRHNMLDSTLVSKDYVIMEKCATPAFTPNGGIFAGSVVVRILSDTIGGCIVCTKARSFDIFFVRFLYLLHCRQSLTL
jgi:hypothetical protein